MVRTIVLTRAMSLIVRLAVLINFGEFTTFPPQITLLTFWVSILAATPASALRKASCVTELPIVQMDMMKRCAAIQATFSAQATKFAYLKVSFVMVGSIVLMALMS
jgi:hypothetical protein